MRKKQSIYIGIGVGATLVAIAVVYLTTSMQDTPKVDSLALDFTYDDAFKNVGENLKSNGIVMSTDLRFKDYKNAEICRNFFAKPEMQKLVEYCASAELHDGDKNFLGNMHMVGSPAAPKLVVVLIQSDPMISQLDQIKTIFDLVIDELVCTCWEEVKPGGYDTVGDWIDALRDFHTGGDKPHTASKALPFTSMHLQIELTTNKDGYLWELLLAR
ncbi:MAG: hypothetical protein ACT4N1_06240 [Nitrososphaerota archaeon]